MISMWNTTDMSLIELLKEYRSKYLPRTMSEWNDIGGENRFGVMYMLHYDKYEDLRPLVDRAEKNLGTISTHMSSIDYDTLNKIFDLAERYAKLQAFA